MIHIALIDPELADAVNADTSRDLAVVWSGPDVEALIAATIDPLPDVIVLDRARLPADPGPTLQRLRRRIPARTVITTYTFAQSRDVEALRQGGSDVVLQGPLSVRTLRTFLLSLLIERRMKTPPPGPSVEEGVIPPRFSRATLLALRDMKSAIQCECPNHVSELVERLAAFETYSKECENRDDVDAQVHRALWFATARARRIMEDALDKLMKHEGLVVEGTTVRRITSAERA